MKTHFHILVILILVTLAGTKAASQPTTLRLDSFFQSLHQYKEINGNVLVAENGNVIYKRSFGFADFENKCLNTDNTRFALASVSKTFTSVAVLQLRDKKKFNLDDPLVKYLPDFPYPAITIRNLLSHTSGLPDYQLYEEQINNNQGKIFTNKDVLPSLKMWKHQLEFKPGEKWQYSNTNFCLLALLVEKVSGISFTQYVKKYIFKPVGMTETCFQNDPAQLEDENKAHNYEYPFLFSDKQKDVDSIAKYRWRTYNASGFVGQGNIMTTTGDMLKFDNALYLGKILKLSTLNEAFSPTRLTNGSISNAAVGMGKASYGLGWFIMADTSAGKIVWHTGGQPGALSIFMRNITKKQTAIMFDNAFDRSLYGNGLNVLAILNNKPVTIRKKSLTREYSKVLTLSGADAAFCKMQILKIDSAHYYLSEDDMNELGLQLLYAATFANHNSMSLEVLKLNILLFPASFNTYDSYGEALAKTGKKQEAIFMYKRSLELNPGNEGGKQALKLLSGSSQ
ncbi:serine hydrolase [Mucilaginibacter sp.]|jgi:CubicO group peptidase (beta-lactamase class C family)|uniref:serine hydrolase n=1 Tax=Mucilaginibacter sp. TaxID=1882438 RepID=UPI002CD2C494|nr:serine hydrolase [Mucilaginibacter sp.]HTI60858.1 serine hydrolase [Mucilaginibacter sp.]